MCQMATRILPVDNIIELLGGPHVLGKDIRSHLALIPLLRKGLPYAALEALSCTIDVSINAVARSLRLPRRTLARRKDQNRLDTHASERVLRLAAVAARAIMNFSSVQHGRTWLIAENRGLGGVAPITLLDTDVGARAAEEVLIRMYPSYDI